jgi:DNA-binding SARP family transcriptional activator
MEIRLLGPVAVRRDGADVVVGARMPRTLLAVLAADAGRSVQVDTLVERMWGPSPPERPRHALHVYVARVRAAIGADVVVRRCGGYVLDVPPQAVDVYRFRDLVAGGRLSAALDLSRGVPVEDLTGPWAERTRAALERRYVDAAVAWSRQELGNGDADGVIERLGDICDRHPLAEPLSAALMLALDAAGRRAEALHRFAATRQCLREELGAEPGAHLRSVHLRLLRTV